MELPYIYTSNSALVVVVVLFIVSPFYDKTAPTTLSR